MRGHMGGLFTLVIKGPLYNALVAIVDVVPGGDVGVAIVLLTVAIKLILLPLSVSAIKSQIAMREIDPELKRLKVEFKDKPEELGRRTMALFKEKKVNPLATIAVLFVQIPIVLGLYRVFLFEGHGGTFDPSLLYSFISVPQHASFVFLGLIALTGKSMVLAVIVAVSQFLYARVLTPPAPGEKGSFQGDLARSMHVQMRYVFPVVMGFIAYVVPAAVGLYFVVSNIFALGQELAVKRLRHAPVTAQS